MLHHRFLAIVLLLPVSAVCAAADAPLTRHFGATDSCYQRVYSDAHLAKHPQQKVTYMRLDHFPLFSGPFGADDQPMIYPDAREIVLFLTVHMRGIDQELENTGFCWPDGDGMSCGIECDGGQFALEDRGADRILLRLKNEIYFADCGEGDIALDPEPDDRAFLLHRLPAGDCVPPG